MSALPLLTQAIDRMRAAAEEPRQHLEAARQRPCVLEDATVVRITQVITTQANDLWRYEEQVACWQQTPHSVTQRQEVERLRHPLSRPGDVVQYILTLAGDLKALPLRRF